MSSMLSYVSNNIRICLGNLWENVFNNNIECRTDDPQTVVGSLGFALKPHNTLAL